MITKNPTTAAMDRMDELKETLKKEKVKLTPEVEGYIQEHVRAVQDKLQNGEDVYQEDLAFIGQVKLWVSMPEEWRKKYVSVEEMWEAEEMKNVTDQAVFEANSRHISLKQWLDVLHVAKAAGKSMDWIDKTFTFAVDGVIEVEEGLVLSGCTGLTCLPEGLYISDYLVLSGCTGLTTLPEGLEVGWDLDLIGCTGLTSLSEGLKLQGNLDLEGCTGLTCLPEGLKVERQLNLTGCTGLTSLPEGLEVGYKLNLSENLHEQVKKDAERLKAEGRIGGKIEYI